MTLVLKILWNLMEDIEDQLLVPLILQGLSLKARSEQQAELIQNQLEQLFFPYALSLVFSIYLLVV